MRVMRSEWRKRAAAHVKEWGAVKIAATELSLSKVEDLF